PRARRAFPTRALPISKSVLHAHPCPFADIHGPGALTAQGCRNPPTAVPFSPPILRPPPPDADACNELHAIGRMAYGGGETSCSEDRKSTRLNSSHVKS